MFAKMRRLFGEKNKDVTELRCDKREGRLYVTGSFSDLFFHEKLSFCSRIRKKTSFKIQLENCKTVEYEAANIDASRERRHLRAREAEKSNFHFLDFAAKLLQTLHA